MSNRLGVSPRFDEVKVGDTLPRRVIGPHSIASFTTEYRAFLFNIWGTFHWVAPPGMEDPWVYQDPGWGEDFAFDEEDAKIDPRKRDGLYVGPIARAYRRRPGQRDRHGPRLWLWRDDGRLVHRLSRATGPATTAMVRHSKADFRTPAFEGDVTYFDAEIVDKQAESHLGCAVSCR